MERINLLSNFLIEYFIKNSYFNYNNCYLYFKNEFDKNIDITEYDLYDKLMDIQKELINEEIKEILKLELNEMLNYTISKNKLLLNNDFFISDNIFHYNYNINYDYYIKDNELCVPLESDNYNNYYKVINMFKEENNENLCKINRILKMDKIKYENFTIGNLIRGYYNVKSVKNEHWKELFCGIKNIKLNNDCYNLTLDFDYDAYI